MSRLNAATEYFEVIEPYIDDALISRPQRDRLRRLMDHVPARAVAHTLYEVRLGTDAPGADYCVSIDPALCRNLIQAGGPQPFSSAPRTAAWDAVRRLIREWMREGSFADENLAHIWFEFDASEEPTRLPPPSLFLNTGRFNQRLVSPCSAEARARLFGEFCAGIAGILDLGLVSDGYLRTIDFVCRRLPPGYRVEELGVMLSRDPVTVRLVIAIRALSAPEMTAFLESVGWTGDASGLRNRLGMFEDYFSHVALQLDLSESGVNAPIGLEIFFDQPLINKGDPPWKRLIDRLCEAELCVPSKRDALLRFSRYVLENDANRSVWPGNLKASFREQGTRYAFVNMLNHIKLAYPATGEVEIKAYLDSAPYAIRKDSKHYRRE